MSLEEVQSQTAYARRKPQMCFERKNAFKNENLVSRNISWLNTDSAQDCATTLDVSVSFLVL